MLPQDLLPQLSATEQRRRFYGSAPRAPLSSTLVAERWRALKRVAASRRLPSNLSRPQSRLMQSSLSVSTAQPVRAVFPALRASSSLSSPPSPPIAPSTSSAPALPSPAQSDRSRHLSVLFERSAAERAVAARGKPSSGPIELSSRLSAVREVFVASAEKRTTDLCRR